MLEELVDHGKDNGVGDGLGLEPGTRGEAQENARGERIEKNSSCQQIPVHFVYLHGKKRTQIV